MSHGTAPRPVPALRLPVLVIDDDRVVGAQVQALMDGALFDCQQSLNAADGLAQALRLKPAAVILDLGLPDRPGLELLEQLRARQPSVPVIVLTGDNGVPTAVRAIQLGAAHYLIKPINADEFQVVVHRAVRQALEQAEARELRERRSPASQLATQMGPSAQVAEVARQVVQVAESDLTVLVLGETGAGKELVAQALHRQSPRRDRPLIAVDCGAIAETLMESALFGHEKGAFTGADRRRVGQFQLAAGGTVFLDEIGNLSLALQAKLLRVLSTHEVTPLGSDRSQQISVRIIAATNADLRARVAAGEFREDLYFRLAECTTVLPPLRERAADIRHLARRFMDEAALEVRKPVTDIEPEALALLEAHPWPGNVRELRNVVRMAVLQSGSFQVEAATVTSLLADAAGAVGESLVRAAPAAAVAPLRHVAAAAVEAAERAAINRALHRTSGNISAAARALEVDNKTLHLKLHRYGIRAVGFKRSGPAAGPGQGG